MSATQPQQLVDRFGRTVSYVRLSVTDRCDLRCVYCMPEKMKFVPRTQLLTLEEMEAVGRAFIKLGVDKIRITGGEPLVRQNIMQLFNNLGSIDGLRDLTLTTNATQLKKYARPLKDAGVTRINVSLDTLSARPLSRHDPHRRFDRKRWTASTPPSPAISSRSKSTPWC